MVIVDTSVWIQYLRGDRTPQANTLDALLAVEVITIADLIYMEILQGIPQREQFEKTKRLLDSLNKVSITGFDLALKSAINYNFIRSKGYTIRKSIDVLIGTYCFETNCRLLHCDKDFDYFNECIQINLVTCST
jgi:predicted nucleic acid-binding protein